MQISPVSILHVSSGAQRVQQQQHIADVQVAVQISVRARVRHLGRLLARLKLSSPMLRSNFPFLFMLLLVEYS